MIRTYEDSWCPRCKTMTLGPSCNWCGAAETVRFSPEIESSRCRQYRRFRAANIGHGEALDLLDLVADLTGRSPRLNDRLVSELVIASRTEQKPAAARPLRAPMPVAVAA